MSDAVDESDCYGANLIVILKFQIQIFYICQKIYVIIIIYIDIMNSYNIIFRFYTIYINICSENFEYIKTKEIKKKLVKITII